MHSVLFANTMRGLGLDDQYGPYLDRLPGITLATVNLMSWLRGCIAECEEDFWDIWLPSR